MAKMICLICGLLSLLIQCILCILAYDIRTLTRTDHNAWTFATLSINENERLRLSGSNNYPSVVSFFEQRLVFGNTNNNPQTLWFSKNGDYDNFTVGTDDDDALIYTNCV